VTPFSQHPPYKPFAKWRFHPVLVKGKPGETVYKLRVRFVLILREAVTDLEIESPPEDAPAAGELQANAEFDTPEGPVYRLSKEGGVKAPSILYQPNPELSEKARALREQGTVTISVIFGTNGRPRNFEVTCSSGPDLNENAAEAAQEWRFEPATKNGKPVMVQLSIDFSFRQY
jgi:TonB family protein